jgi:hypothetical protein
LGSAGKLADLIVVDGDPLAEINVLTEPARIALVIGVLGQATAVGRYGLKSGTSLGQGA